MTSGGGSKNNRVTLAALAVVAIVVVVLGLRHFGRGGAEAKPTCNVLLITLDTTRADHLGCYGSTEALTPALDQLAAGGVTFDRAFSNVPLTLPSHTTMLTGLLPPEHGLRVNGGLRLDIPQPTLAEVLHDRGYQTGAFIAAVVLDSANGLNRGFDVYSDQVPEECKQLVSEPLSAYRPGDMVATDALAWLEKRDRAKPFFCWVHFFDPHKPYLKHDALAGTRFAGLESYDSEIAFMDLQVARLTAFLKKENLAGKTLVIAVGDHGEGLGEHGEGAHGFMLYNTTLHVPMVCSMPGRIPGGRRVDATVSLVDLFATVEDMVGIRPVDDRSGRSLAGALLGQELGSEASYAETMAPYIEFDWSPAWSLTTPDRKFIRSARARLFDERADFKELTNLAAARPAEVEGLDKQLKTLQSEMAVHTAGLVAVTPENARRLQALGYAGSNQNLNTQNIPYATLVDVEDRVRALDLLPRVLSFTSRDIVSAESLALLRQIIALSPETAQFRAKLVAMLSTAKMYDDALREALEYLRIKPGDNEVCHTVGTIYAFKGNYPDAVRYYWKSLAIKPDFAPPQEELARALRHEGDPAGAARHMDRSWKLPNDVVERYDLGVVLGAAGKTDEAMSQLQEVLRAAPDDPVVHAAVAGVLEQKGDAEQAAREYSEAIRLGSVERRDFYRLGTLLGKLGRFAEAEAPLAKAVELDPTDVPARTNLALILGKQGKHEEAMRQFDEALRLRPDDVQVHVTKGGVLQDQGRITEALAEFREALRLQPARWDVAAHVARILATHPDGNVRDGATAVTLAEQASRATKDAEPQVLDTLAAAYAEAGRFDEAVATARKALTAATQANKEQLAKDIQGRLELYAARQPYRSPS